MTKGDNMTTEREIKILSRMALAVFATVLIAALFSRKANAAEYSSVAPELHFAQVLYQDEDVSFILTEDGEIWSYEGMSMNTYGQPYIIDEASPIGFTLIDIDTYVGVCVSNEGNCDGTIVIDNGEIADPFYNYISYYGLNVKPGDVVITTDYRIKGTDDDIIYRDDVITHNIYERR